MDTGFFNHKDDAYLQARLNPTALFLRAGMAAVFALICFAFPAPELNAFTFWIGIYLFLDGFTCLLLQKPETASYRPYGWSFLTGACGLAAGIVAFFHPARTSFTLALLVAAWGLVFGALQLMASLQMSQGTGLRKTPRTFVGLLGIASVVLGVVVFLQPLLTMRNLVVAAGINAIFIGLGNLALGAELQHCLNRGGNCALEEETKEKLSA
jgi:uncharacterized membrane protein HdeD (DUF308 family)